MHRRNRFFGALVFGAALIFVLQGCTMMEANRKKQAERIEKLEQQKNNYNTLKKDLADKKVQAGTTEEEITERYGSPQDTFESSSGSSSFALWYYEYPDAGKNQSYNPVRLYFNDKKLLYWSN